MLEGRDRAAMDEIRGIRDEMEEMCHDDAAQAGIRR